MAAPAIFLKNVVGWENYMQKMVHGKQHIRRKQNWDSVNFHKEVLHRPYDFLVILSELLHITAEFKDKQVLICKTYNCIQLFRLVA